MNVLTHIENEILPFLLSSYPSIGAVAKPCAVAAKINVCAENIVFLTDHAPGSQGRTGEG